MSGIKKTFVLVGRIGNGKSSTGNSIIGNKVFKVAPNLAGVTCTSDIHSCTMDDGSIIDVIDTPGLFDTEIRQDYICKEIVKCLDFAKGGIHAVLLVISASRSRFSWEESCTIDIMMDLFGPKITDYMTIILTGADELSCDTTRSELLRSSPPSLKKVLDMCRQRYVFFNNKTEDEDEKNQQVQNLLEKVSRCLEMNNWRPFTNDMMRRMQININYLSRVEYAQILDQDRAQILDSMIKSIQKLEGLNEETQTRRTYVGKSDLTMTTQSQASSSSSRRRKVRQTDGTITYKKPLICSIM